MSQLLNEAGEPEVYAVSIDPHAEGQFQTITYSFLFQKFNFILGAQEIASDSDDDLGVNFDEQEAVKNPKSENYDKAIKNTMRW